MRTEHIVKLAEVSLAMEQKSSVGSHLSEEMASVQLEAQPMAVTYLEFLRARLSIKAGMLPQENWRDEGLGDEQC